MLNFKGIEVILPADKIPESFIKPKVDKITGYYQTINESFINALLADATYALKQNGLEGKKGVELEKLLKARLTDTLAEFIGDNFTVVTHKETNDAFGSGFDATVWKDKSDKTYVSMTGSTPEADFLADIDLEQVAA